MWKQGIRTLTGPSHSKQMITEVWLLGLVAKEVWSDFILSYRFCPNSQSVGVASSLAAVFHWKHNISISVHAHLSAFLFVSSAGILWRETRVCAKCLPQPFLVFHFVFVFVCFLFETKYLTEPWPIQFSPPVSH